MSEATGGDGGGDEEIVAMLKQEFPAPLDILLINLYDRNRDYWLSPAMRNTLGAAAVRQQGLTPPQMEWALAVAEQMDGDHELWDGGPTGEGIESDTSADDYLGGDLR